MPPAAEERRRVMWESAVASPRCAGPTPRQRASPSALPSEFMQGFTPAFGYFLAKGFALCTPFGVGIMPTTVVPCHQPEKGFALCTPF